MSKKLDRSKSLLFARLGEMDWFLLLGLPKGRVSRFSTLMIDELPIWNETYAATRTCALVNFSTSIAAIVITP